MPNTTITKTNTRISVYQRKRKLMAIFCTMMMIASILSVFTIFGVNKSYATGSSSSVIYEQMTSGAFEYSDTSTKTSKKAEDIAGNVLGVILPIMVVFALSMMVITMAASVFYYLNPPFWDEVHYLHFLRKQKKYESAQGGNLKAWFQLMKEVGLADSLFKSVICPDVKRLAFSEVSEIGEDGRPSFMLFLKTKVPKYIGLMALMMVVCNTDALRLYAKGATVAVWFVEKAESFDYVRTLERAVNSGSDYKPAYSNGKLRIFTSVYDAIKGLDKSPGTETSQYKHKVGSLVDQWVLATFKESEFNFGSLRVNASSYVSTVPVVPNGETQIADGNGTIYQNSLEKFGVTSSGEEKYVITRIEFITIQQSESKRMANQTYKDAVTQSGNVIKIDMSKIENFRNQKPELLKIERITGVTVNPVDPVNGKHLTPPAESISISGHTATITLSNGNWKSIIFDLTGMNNGTAVRLNAISHPNKELKNAN